MKFLRLFLILCWLYFSGTTLTAQGNDFPYHQNEITVTIGLQQGYFRDYNFSPLNYRSGGFHVGLGYARITDRGNRWNAAVAASVTTLNSDVAKYLQSDRYVFDASFGYRWLVTQDDQDRRALVGLNYRSYVDLSLYDGSEAITFLGLHGLELAGDTEWSTGDRHRLKASLALPVFGLLVRPPYTGWDKFIIDNASNIPRIITRGNWTSLNDYFGLRGQLGWEYRLGDHWSVEARYSLAYYATRHLDPVRVLNNQFSLSAIRKH